jgi:hypothetical protein
VRRVTYSASFSQGLVLENKGPCLLAVALAAIFILPGHGQAAFRLKNILPMRIMALDAIHMALIDRMMLRQPKLSLDLEMAIVTSRRIFAGVDDELSTTPTCLDVLAARAVTRFTAGRALHLRGFHMDAGVRTGRESASNVRVAFVAGFVADKLGARNLRRRNDPAGKVAAGNQQESADRGGRAQQRQPSHETAPLDFRVCVNGVVCDD